MKRIILALAMIVVLGGIVGSATGAFFSDTETSTGNTFTAGSLDLKVDSQCHYFQDNVDVGCTALEEGSRDPVAFGNWTETDLVPGVHKFFNFNDIKPGDRGESTISLHVYDNDAWGRFTVSSTSQADNSCNEPEVDAEPGCAGDLTQGELDETMTALVWLDQGTIPGFQNAGPNGVVVDTNPNATGTQPIDTTEGDNLHQETEPLLATSTALFGTTFNLWTLLADAREAATSTCSVAAVNGHVPGTASSTDPYGECNGLAVDGRMVGSTTYYFGWQWDLPASVGNEVQTDSVGGDVIFNVVQHRNNPNKVF